MGSFESLAVWRAAHEVCLECYQLCGKLPAEERFALASQLRRAASSVPANIVEGNERTAPADFAHFMDIALGSAAEVQYYLILARDLGYVSAEETHRISQQAAGMVRMLRQFQAEGRRTRTKP